MPTLKTDPAGLAGLGQVVLVFQGGGALGAYQAGVYEALAEAGVEVDWVIGTSIGAINAALIAGNRPEDRVDRLRAFWREVQQSPFAEAIAQIPFLGPSMVTLGTLAGGIPNFFEVNPASFGGQRIQQDPENVGYYSTKPLRKTLARLVDYDRANSGFPRLTVGAANVSTAEMRYFDTRKETLSEDHILASGALPPAFPPVRINGELYWDGGILSNTPTEVIFDDNPRRDCIVFSVHVWHPQGEEPRSIWEATNRQKDLQYASRALSQIQRQRQMHRLRHVIAELGRRMPDQMDNDPLISDMKAFGCTTKMHVVRLLAPRLPDEDHTKDIDFSAKGIAARWSSGYLDMRDVLLQTPWTQQHDPLEGFILHELTRGPTVQEVK